MVSQPETVEMCPPPNWAPDGGLQKARAPHSAVSLMDVALTHIQTSFMHEQLTDCSTDLLVRI